MTMRILTIVLAAMTGLFASAQAQDRAPALAVGQEYSIHGEGLESVRVVIGRLETIEGLGPVVHISVSGIPAEYLPAGVVGHLPYRADALLDSLDQLTGRGTVQPEFGNGIAHWRNAQGGVFSGSLAEIITVLIPSTLPPDPGE